MPTITSNREYSTSKNIKMYLIHNAREYQPGTGDGNGYVTNSRWEYMTRTLGNLDQYKGYYAAQDANHWTPSEGSGGPFSSTYISGLAVNKVPNLQEIPDLANASDNDRDTIEITTLEDEYHEFADGLKNRNTDSNNITFTFLYDSQCYKAIQDSIKRIKKVSDYPLKETFTLSGTTQSFANLQVALNLCVIELPSGELFSFHIKDISSTLNGAGVGAPLTYSLNFAIDGDIDFYIPTEKSWLLNRAGILNGTVNSYKVYTGDSTAETTNYWKEITAEQKQNLLGW